MQPSHAEKSPNGMCITIAILGIQSVFTVGYWISYFSGPPPPFPQHWYTTYESAFPLADISVIVLNSLLCIFHLCAASGRRRSGLKHGLIAVGGMYFLVAMDILFNIRNGMYAYVLPGHGTADQQLNMIVELVINIWCVICPTWLTHWIFENLDWFVADPRMTVHHGDTVSLLLPTAD